MYVCTLHIKIGCKDVSLRWLGILEKHLFFKDFILLIDLLIFLTERVHGEGGRGGAEGDRT